MVSVFCIHRSCGIVSADVRPWTFFERLCPSGFAPVCSGGHWQLLQLSSAAAAGILGYQLLLPVTQRYFLWVSFPLAGRMALGTPATSRVRGLLHRIPLFHVCGCRGSRFCLANKRMPICPLRSILFPFAGFFFSVLRTAASTGAHAHKHRTAAKIFRRILFSAYDPTHIVRPGLHKNSVLLSHLVSPVPFTVPVLCYRRCFCMPVIIRFMAYHSAAFSLAATGPITAKSCLLDADSSLSFYW